jgi:sialidase-1
MKVAALLCVAFAASFAVAETTTVYRAGEDGYHTYRIPAIVRAENGDLLAFAEGRKNGGGDAGNIDLVLKRSGDGGATWGAMTLVQDEWSAPSDDVCIGNPVPIVDRLDPEHPGRVWLVFCRDNDRVFVTHSDDHGQTWSERRDITAEAKRPEWKWYATGPTHGVQLERGAHAGRLIVPSDHGTAKKRGWGVHMLHSDDHGATWQVGAVDTRGKNEPLHPNECAAVELTDGRLYVNARDQHGVDPATRMVAHSSDGGATFDTPFVGEPAIVSPVVQNSLVRFAAKDQGDARDILVYAGPGHAQKRRDFTMRVSYDESATWPVSKVIAPAPAAYSDLVKLDNEAVGVIYEAGEPLYAEIVFQRVVVADLE